MDQGTTVDVLCLKYRSIRVVSQLRFSQLEAILYPVFPVAPFVVIIGWILYAIAGMAIGALSGWLASLITKRDPKGILRDAFLGSFGFLAGFIGCIFMPWPRNTVVEHLEGGGSVATTMNTYQHPERVAAVMAVLLPLLYELYRFKRARTDSDFGAGSQTKTLP